MAHKKVYALVSVQMLVEVPEDVPTQEVSEYGCDWITEASQKLGVLDYRHPRIAGVFQRPVPVLVKDVDADDIFEDSNLIQM
jgi:hypothetical protein